MMIASIIAGIVNLSQVYPSLSLVLITLLPITELRASIPYGILALHMNWFYVFILCVVTNILLGLVLYLLIDKIVAVITYFRPIDKWYRKYIEKKQERIRIYVDRYGYIGVAVFIGIPLPGSGVYTGALVSYLLGLEYKKFVIACIVGVLVAGTMMTLISLTGLGLFLVKGI